MNKIGALTCNKEMISDRRISAALGVLFFVMATALGAYARIPVKGSPVPITLQTFFVILSGAVLGKRLGLFSQTAYLFLGVLGFPLFEGRSFGFLHLLGPTGGYLFGFIVAAYLVGFMTESKKNEPIHAAASFIFGSLVIYFFGALWLNLFFKANLIDAISIGVLPFIPGDIVKVFVAAAIYTRISRRSKAIFSA